MYTVTAWLLSKKKWLALEFEKPGDPNHKSWLRHGLDCGFVDGIQQWTVPHPVNKMRIILIAAERSDANYSIASQIAQRTRLIANSSSIIHWQLSEKITARRIRLHLSRKSDKCWQQLYSFTFTSLLLTQHARNCTETVNRLDLSSDSSLLLWQHWRFLTIRLYLSRMSAQK